MPDTLQITNIRIQNFRSIIDERFDVKQINLFVGLNDVGKSNVLRALDLFFNDEDAASSFSFVRDFCYFAKTPLKKPKEIKIQITVKLPPTYGTKEVIWKKTWRVNGQEPEEILFADRDALSPKSKIPSLLNSIRFEYVPAVKSENYFAKILEDLHGVLIETVEKKIRDASAGFTRTINQETKSALSEIEKRLGIKSTIELPSDLKDLFSRLDFRSDQNAMSLSQRGDGIKARHIPILLRFIAQQADSVRAKGSPRTTTIWGFEEPENNLEMGKSIELAQEFLEYSSDIQIFTTTHSPAFYSLPIKNRDRAALFLLKPGADGHKETKIEPIDENSVHVIDDHIGFLPSISPLFMKAWGDHQAEIKKFQQMKKHNRPTIFVEGVTDVKIFSRAISVFSPNLVGKIDIERCGGASGVKDYIISWILRNNKEKAVGIFDSDNTGKEQKSELASSPRVQKQMHGGGILLVVLEPTEAVQAIFKADLKIPVTLEELFPVSIWKIAQARGWLEARENVIDINKFRNTSISFEQYCSEKVISDNVKILLFNKVSDNHKEALTRHICSLPDSEVKVVLTGLEKIVLKIEKFFSLQ